LVDAFREKETPSFFLHPFAWGRVLFAGHLLVPSLSHQKVIPTDFDVFLVRIPGFRHLLTPAIFSFSLSAGVKDFPSIGQSSWAIDFDDPRGLFQYSISVFHTEVPAPLSSLLTMPTGEIPTSSFLFPINHNCLSDDCHW